MLQDILSRIEARLVEVGKSATEASRDAGLSEDAIRNLKRAVRDGATGRKGTTSRTISLLAPVLKTTPGWLLDGVGDADAVVARAQAVPVISWVSAGRMGNVDAVSTQEVERYISIAELPDGDWFALDVRGQSMDRVAPEGSVIIVNRADRALVSGKFYVFSTRDGEATFKRFRTGPARYVPYSTSPDEEPIYPDHEEDREWRVVGRVHRVILAL